jgi:hypothetical protein
MHADGRSNGRWTYAAQAGRRSTINNVVLRVVWMRMIVNWTGDTGRDGPLRTRGATREDRGEILRAVADQMWMR